MFETKQSRRQLLASSLMTLALPALAGAEAPRYAVLSLVGDSMTIVSFAPQTGSHMDNSERQVIPLREAELDQAVLLRVESELKKTLPGAAPDLLVPGGAKFYEQKNFFDGDSWQANAALQPALGQLSATHLILLTKHRSSKGLTGVKTTSTVRALEGIGFYVDSGWRERAGNAVVDGSGLLAPYAHLRLSLIDLSTRKVLGHKIIAANGVIPTPAGFADAWASVPDAQKMSTLSTLLCAEVARVLPELLPR